MKQIQIWQKQSETIDPNKGGYSDMRLWPAYMISSLAILTLAPLIGSFFAFALVLTPAFYIAVRVAKAQNSSPEAIARYEAQMFITYNETAESNELDAIKPTIQSEEVIELKNPRNKPASRLSPSFSS